MSLEVQQEQVNTQNISEDQQTPTPLLDMNDVGTSVVQATPPVQKFQKAIIAKHYSKGVGIKTEEKEQLEALRAS
jgi:hypothetical protein